SFKERGMLRNRPWGSKPDLRLWLAGRVRVDELRAHRPPYFFFLAGVLVDRFLAAGLAFALAEAFAGTLTETDFLAGFSGLAALDSRLASFASVSFASLFDPESSSRSARLRFSSLSDLKSVSYQPLPFKRKFGADTSFLSVFFLQLGHCFKGSSVIFCRAST